MNEIWQEYRRTLKKELGEELAQEFVDSLYSQSRGCVKVATQFFYTLGTMWAPIMFAWSEWVKQNAQGTVAIVLRDAKPLAAMPSFSAHRWQHLYLNRLLCGVEDELSGDGRNGQHPLLTRYLAQYGCSDTFTYVDSGCYGTIVLKLYNQGVTCQPLFLFSKNPSIRGFVNECGISTEEGTILNDSFECGFPHVFVRPSELVEKKGKVKAVLYYSDPLSVQFGRAAMQGVRDSKQGDAVSGREAAQALLLLSQNAHRRFTGILGHPSPEWSKKKEFLSSWPKHLCWV